MTFFGCKRGVVVVSQFAGAVLRSWSTPRVGILRQAAFALFACAFATTTFATVGINKSFTPNSVSAGQVSTLTIVLLNPNATPATGIDFTDFLPANVVVATPLTFSTLPLNCVDTSLLAAGATSIHFPNGTIPAISGGVPGQCQVTVNVVSILPNTYLNTIPNNAVTSSNGSNPQDAQATLVVSALVNVTGAKAFLPTTVHGNGAPSTLTITLTNPNVVPLNLSAAFTDTLPANVTIATPSNVVTTCPLGTATASAPATNPSTVTLATGAQIPASGSCTIKVDVIARNPNAAVNAASTNTIAAGALKTLEGVTSPAITANVTVQTGGAITKAFSPATIPVGGTTPSTLTITITNFNDSILTPITFTDNLPAGMTVTGVPASTCIGALTNTLTSVTLTGASLAAFSTPVAGNKSCTITLQVFATSTRNNSIAAGNWGGVAYSGTGNVSLTVRTIGGSKAFSAAVQNGTTTMTITLQNSASSAAAITSLTDLISTLGAGFTFAAAPTIGGTCGSVLSTSTATSFVVTGGSIPAAVGPVLGSCTITVGPISISTAATVATHTNTIAVNGVVTSLGNNAATITGNVAVGRALTVSKAFNPTTVQAGTKSRLTVTLTRAATASDLTGIGLTDNLTSTMGAGFVVATPPNAATTCTGATFSPVLAGGEAAFTVAGGSLANANPPPTNFSCTISVDVATTGASVGAHTNAIPGANVTTAQAVTLNDTTAVLTINNSTVTVNKSFSPTTVAVGAATFSTMTLQIRNNNAGAITLTGAGLVDNLPVGMVFATVPTPTLNGCGAATLTPSAVAPWKLTLANATVNAAAICTATIRVSAMVSGNLINNIPPGTVTSAQGVTNPLQGTATLAATGTVKLTVTKTNGVSSITPGGTTTYTMGVSNAGPNDVAGLLVNDTPPAGVTFGTWTCLPTGGAICGTGSGPIADIVTIPNGGSITYTVPATIAPNVIGTLTNTINVVVPGSVINTGGTTASDSDPAVPVTNLAITKSDGSTTFLPGGNATYVMVLTNGGPSDASNVAIADTLPPGVTQNGPASCIPAGAGALCGAISNLGTGFSVSGAYVPAGGGASLSYSLPVDFGAGMSAPSITNTVTATNAASSGPGSSASASDTNTIVLFTPTLGKSIVPGTIAAGGTATLTLVLGNPNAGATSLTALFIDNMPAGITTTSGNTGSCTGVTVTAASISKASGSILPSGGCTIIVTITSTTPGTATNTTGSLQTVVGTAPPASAPLTVNAAALTLTKTILPANIVAGGTSTLTLTLGNSNATAQLLTAAFTDPMPGGVTTTGGNTGTCTGVIVASALITVPSGTSIPSGGCSIIVTITSSTPGLVTNT
ncbi:MAG: hypothetical protein ABI607_11465, partial [Betaproteobacteria bacterium]